MHADRSVSSRIHVAAIGLGSNLGASLTTLQTAWRELLAHPEVTALALSHPYLTEPVGIASVNRFVNAAGLVQTGLAPHALLRHLHAIEARHGRRRLADGAGSLDRTLDLDLLLYDQQVVHDGGLILPHPRMHHRLFVLVPLAEIAADFVHPLTHKTIGALVAASDNRLAAQRIEQVSWLSEDDTPC